MFLVLLMFGLFFCFHCVLLSKWRFPQLTKLVWSTASPARLLLRGGDQQLSSALLPLSGEEWTRTVSAGSEVNHFSRFSPVKNTPWMAFWWVTFRCLFLAFDLNKKSVQVHISVIYFLHCCHNMAITAILFTAQEDHMSGHHRKLIHLLINYLHHVIIKINVTVPWPQNQIQSRLNQHAKLNRRCNLLY